VRIDSVNELKLAFEVWRSKKRHVRETVPAELLARARRAISVHGLGAVARATKLERQRLKGKRVDGRTAERKVAVVTPMPSFSRMELSAPSVAAHAFAELEMSTGVKLRLFSQSPETLGLLSSLCGLGGGGR
jgi:hypothetical protein